MVTRIQTKIQPNIFFFGSDAFSSIILKQLHISKHLWNQLYLVVPPISRTGRGLKKIYRPPLLELATELNLPCHTLTKPNPQENPLKNWSLPNEFNFQGGELKGDNQDQEDAILITASFPYKIPSRIIDLFKQSKALNVHPSLLPLYRGPAPIQWQIAHQQSHSGVTIQDLSAVGFDRGRILAQNYTALSPSINYIQAEIQLAHLASETLLDVINHLDQLIANAKPQDESKATHAPKITQSDLRIYPSMTIDQVKARYHGMGHQYPLSIKVNSDIYFVIPQFFDEETEINTSGNTLNEAKSKETLLKKKEKVIDWIQQIIRHNQRVVKENKEEGCCLLGKINFNKKLNLIAIMLSKSKNLEIENGKSEFKRAQQEEGRDILVINKFKLVAPGGKGWIDPDQWWDRLINQSQNSASSTTNHSSLTPSTQSTKKDEFFLAD